MGPTISDSRWTAANEATVEGVLRSQFALGDDNSAVSMRSAAPWFAPVNVDANTQIGTVSYAMLSGSPGAFSVNTALANSLAFNNAYFYVRAGEATGPERGYALDLTGPLSSYLGGGTDEQDLREAVGELLQAAEVPNRVIVGGVGSTNGMAYRAAGFGSSVGSATGDIKVDVGPALAAALGLDAGANLDKIGRAFVGLKYPGWDYIPGSAVLMTEFGLTKLGAQNALRTAAGVGYAARGSAGLVPVVLAGPAGFFAADGLSSEWTRALQDRNGDVGGVLDDLSSHQAYSKFTAISAGSLLSGLPADTGINVYKTANYVYVKE